MSMVLLSQLARELNLELVGEGDPALNSFVCDSRKVESGAMFAAVPGAVHDGRSFIENAQKKGAVALMLADSDYSCPLPRLIVPAARMRSLMASAAAIIYERPAEKLQMIGLTGTNGKTTCSYLLESVLNEAGQNPGVMGTINFRWPGHLVPAANTTPEGPELQTNLGQMMKAGAKSAILEVSSHSLELGRVATLNFDWALFNNLSRDHLDFHADMEDYFNAKRKLFLEHLKDGEGRAVINVDDVYGQRLAEELGPRALTFAFENEAQVKGRILKSGRDGLKIEIVSPHASWTQVSPLLSAVNAYNLLAVVSVSLAMGLDPVVIQNALSSAAGAPGRLESVGDNPDYLVLVDYAHSPEALEKVLQTGRELCEKRLLVVFGCGGDRDKGKRPMMGQIAHSLADIRLITSDNPRTEEPWSILEDIIAGLPGGLTRYEVGELNTDEQDPLGYIATVDRRVAIHEGVRLMAPGDVLIIAGKGHEDYQIMGHEKRYFDDRKEALGALTELGRLK